MSKWGSPHRIAVLFMTRTNWRMIGAASSALGERLEILVHAEPGSIPARVFATLVDLARVDVAEESRCVSKIRNLARIQADHTGARGIHCDEVPTHGEKSQRP